MRTRLGFLVVLAAMVILGCGGSTEPQPTGGVTYVLRRVAGDALPTLLATNDVGQIRVYADTILLAGDGTGSRSAITEFIPTIPGIPNDGPGSSGSPLHYRVGIDRVEISFDCPPNANCVAGPHLVGELREQGLELQWGPLLTGREPMEYARVH